MLTNYFKIAWRNLLKNRTSSLINISGLAIGMTVAMLIALWVWDEWTFDKNFENYDRIAQVMQNSESNGLVRDRKSTRLNSSHRSLSRMPSSA